MLKPMAGTLVAYDGSKSTEGCAFYHDWAQRIVGALRGEPTILLWDHSHKVISRARLDEINKKRLGFGFTNPEQIARFVTKTGFDGHLVIITDGQVQSVAMCDEVLGRNWAFERVTVYLIGYRSCINMSVSCPFTRCSPHAVHVLDPSAEERPPAMVVSQKDLDLLNRLETIGSSGDFMQKADAIERAVVARTMGTTGDPSLRDSILAMKKRIVAAQASAKGESDSVVDLTKALENGDTTRAVQLAKALTAEYYGDDDDQSWSRRVDRLVSMCDGALIGTFDLSGIKSAIQGDRVRRAAEATVAPPTSAPSTDAAGEEANGSGSFTCPISLDKAQDVVILVSDEGKPLLVGLDKDVVNDILECPLNLFKYPDAMERLKDKLDRPVSLEVLKAAEALGRPLAVSPFTRRRVHGAICLGGHEEHCKATTWALARAVAGGKLAGNPDLWYACVWLMVEYGHVEWLKETLPQLRANMVWRARNRRTSLSLSGSPELPTTKVPFGVAAWYVLGSAAVGLPPGRDVLRAHMPHVDHIQKLVALVGYALPEGVEGHVQRLRCMLGMLAAVKRDPHSLPNAVAALTQRCITISAADVSASVADREARIVKYIPIDGPPTEAQIADVHQTLPQFAASLDIATLVGLIAMVHPSKSASDIHLPMSWTTPPLPAAVVEWGYGLDPAPEMVHSICPATCRPFYLIGQETWKEQSERRYGSLSGQLSVSEHFGNFVVKHGAFPKRADFLTYLYNRLIVFGGHKTLPAPTEAFWKDTQRIYSRILVTLKPAEFAHRFKAARPIEERKKVESLPFTLQNRRIRHQPDKDHQHHQAKGTASRKGGK